VIRIGRADLVAPLDEAYMAASEELDRLYASREHEPHHTFAELSAICDEWWERAFDIIAQYRVSAGVFSVPFLHPDTSGLMPIRPGMIELMHGADAWRVPFIVFSAGIGDVVCACLRSYGLSFGRMEIVSNMCRFEEDGRFHGRLENSEVIHSFSKNERHLGGLDRFSLTNRSNLLLFGDSLGDAGMVSDAEGRTVIRVGICTATNPETIERYRQMFDVVLMPDEVDQFCRWISTLLLADQ